MRGVRAFCIDDKNKPSEIPIQKWIVKDKMYHITHVFVMMQQGRIQGCELAEKDISDCKPYDCFRLSRFAIVKEDFEKLIQLMKDCNDLDNVQEKQLIEFVEQVEIKELV